MMISVAFKKLLGKIIPEGPFLPGLLELSRFSSWVKANPTSVVLPVRQDLYRHVSEEHVKGEPIDYLEFGVWEGETIMHWAELSASPDSRFHGFDTFTGLPEDWVAPRGMSPKGKFSTDGKQPESEDSRVSYHKGLFQKTLPGFLKSYEPKNRLVIHMDADLYSSTLFVLAACDAILKPGTILIFDEFNCVLHEFRALNDYCSAYMREYRHLGTSGENFLQIAIEMN